MFLLVENYQIDYSCWSSERQGIFEETMPQSPWLFVIEIVFGVLMDDIASSSRAVWSFHYWSPTLVALREENVEDSNTLQYLF